MADAIDLTKNAVPSAYRMGPDALARLLSTPGMTAQNLYGEPKPAPTPVDVPPPRDPKFGRPVKLTIAGNAAPDDAPPDIAMPAQPMPNLVSARKPIPAPVYAPPDEIATPISVDDKRYKPSLARTLLGSLAGAAMTYGKVPDAAERMDAAINAPRRRAEQTRQGLLDAYNRKYQGNRQLFEDTLKSEADTRAQQNSDSLAAQREANAKSAEERARVAGELADTKQQLADARDPEVIQAQRVKNADAVGLKGRDRQIYLLNGKVPEGLTEYQQRSLALRERELAKKGEKQDKPKGPLPPNQARLMNTAKDNEIKEARTRFENGEITKDDYLALWQAAQDKFEQSIANAGYDPGEHYIVRDNVDDRLMPKKGATSSTPVAKPEAAPAATQPKPAQKTASPAEIRKFAKAKGMSYGQVERQLKAAGYTIR